MNMNMKQVFLISVVVLVCLAAAAAAADNSTTPRQVDCQNHTNDFCTREYVPLCGTDGKTHSNMCELCVEIRRTDKDIRVVNDGECVKST